MAKQTRAQRKKSNQRAQYSQKPAADEALVSDSLEAESAKEPVEASTEDIAPAQKPAAESPKKASKAEAQTSAKKTVSKAEAQLSAKQEKQNQKLKERERKAAAKADAKAKKTTRRGPKFFWRFIDYIKNVRVEMKRVVWPSRDELVKMSLIVIIALAFFGVLIYAVDSAVTPLLYLFSSLGG